MNTPSSRRQRGITLVEALVGFLVLSLGLLGAIRLQSWLRLNGDVAQQRTEAVRLAQQDVEQLRSFAGQTAFRLIADGERVAADTPTSFKLTRKVNEAQDGTLKLSRVSVSWQDRSGAAQTVHLQSSLVGTPPAYAAALALPAQDTTVAPRRHLPRGATWLGDGRSVVKPGSRSTIAWIVDNASGLVTAQCSVPATLAVHAITPADLGRCSPAAGGLLSGYIRFSSGAALALSVELLLDTTGDNTPRCEVDTAGSSAREERHLAYTCFVPQPATGAGWSGQVRLLPEGWVFGDTASAFKACRYSADHDHSGRIDRNDEHPERYTQVRGSLTQQNYLVIRGDGACPGALPPHNDASVATVQHQP